MYKLRGHRVRTHKCKQVAPDKFEKILGERYGLGTLKKPQHLSSRNHFEEPGSFSNMKNMSVKATIATALSLTSVVYDVVNDYYTKFLCYPSYWKEFSIIYI